MIAAKLIPAIMALGLATAACSGSRPALDPTDSLAPSTSVAATTSTAVSTTFAAPTTTQAVAVDTTSTTLPTATTEYPSVGPLQTVPPAVYPTTG